jgi:hypothetical protein
MQRTKFQIATVVLLVVGLLVGLGARARSDVSPPAIISADTAKELHEVGELKTEPFFSFDWVPGSNELAVVPFKGEIEVFDTKTLKFQRKLATGIGQQQLIRFAFSCDGQYLAWSENSKDVAKNKFTIENLKSGKRDSFEIDRHQPILDFSPDGKWLAAGGYGTKADIWEVATGKKVRDFESDTAGGLTPVFSPDGKILALGNRNSEPRLFDASTGKLLHVLPKKMTQRIRFNPAGTILATANVDGTFGLWDVATGKLLREEKMSGQECFVVEWSAKGDLLVTAGLNAKIIIWDTKELKPLKELDAPARVFCARFTPDGRRLFTSGRTPVPSTEQKITIWGLTNSKP